ncbi:L-aspartate oxidase [Brumimicrobium salinarum]|uniref:L-aspartate oxidase n=1 Tax=Brumimicrobium salinarum TaxID=2058658 RepID=A0A2I0R6E0_9FLAO|nr:L-aspartate oxidase [Brumimicrobium salinarum]PKR82144.1 L-aspartate oxidase [Brumimicrobium salinarum]
MKTKFDILIVGAGIAGLSQALSLAEKEPTLKIGVISKSKLQETNTRMAQGGIAAVMSTQKDSYINHIEDTIKASQNKANAQVVKYVVEHAHDGIHQLENWGVKFDHFKNKYHLGLEGGHSKARILHVKDQTGAAVHDQLIAELSKHPSITVFEYSEVIELLLSETKEIAGAVLYNYEEKSTRILTAKIIVLATGGMGQVFQYTTNSSIASGDGIALAKNIGAEISNLKSIQFHPTAFKEQDKKQMFLISEAVRGAGAYVINENEERFLFKYDPRAELATRDIVSAAIYQELKNTATKNVYLDCRHFAKEVLENEFPYIYNYCLKAGYDLLQQAIPITPAAHYSCGGIQVDINGKTNVPQLYAIGECANTGLHGNNRLASNSLLEAIVFTKNMTESIVKELPKVTFQTLIKKSLNSLQLEHNSFDKINELRQQLRIQLTAYFIQKTEKEKKSLQELLLKCKNELKQLPTQELDVIHFKWHFDLVEELMV